MPMPAFILSAGLAAAQAPVAGAEVTRPCVARQLSLSVDGEDGEFAGMQKSGTELSIRNHGADCTLPALPRIEFLDPRGRPLPVIRQVPVGMHPGPVMVPVHLGGGHRATTDLSWIAGPVYAGNRPLRVGYLRVWIGGTALRVRLADMVDAQPGQPGTFGQPPLRAAEGMAAG